MDYFVKENINIYINITYFRFFADLVAISVFTQKEGLRVLATQLTLLIANDKEVHDNLTIVLSFCKHCGDDYAGLLAKKYRFVMSEML